MSAILQALKRSEAERQGQTIAQSDPTGGSGASNRAVWAWGGLLAIALLAGGWALGRMPAGQAPAQSGESAITAAPPIDQEEQQPSKPMANSEQAPAGALPTLAEPSPSVDEPAAPPAEDGTAVASAATRLASSPSPTPAPPTSTRETVDSEPPPATVTVDLPPPAPRQQAAPAQAMPPQVAHDVATWLPASDMPPGQSRDLLASMQINVHVYATEPENRFVLVNLKRREEGDLLGEGMRIAEIVPAGVVVETAGMRYLWPSR